ncbi:MAG: TaqI-like C-terminal specificity domain-containing protein, partial [Candidatus Thorarchaeota archaeon]
KTSDKDLLLIGTGNVGKYYIDFKKPIKIARRNEEITYFSYQPEYKEVWDKLYSEKIIFREIAKDITCVYDPGVYANLTGLYFIKVSSFETKNYFCLLTILNSSLIDLVFKTLYGTLHMSGEYLRFNGSFIKTIPIPDNLPLTLSYMGKILQFLSHLKYEILYDSNYRLINEIKIKDILNPLNFYEKLSNSLVNQLYLCSEQYNALNKFLDSSILIPNIEFKFMNSRYELPNYITYKKGEIKENLNQIIKSFNLLRKDSKLISQMNSILAKQM